MQSGFGGFCAQFLGMQCLLKALHCSFERFDPAPQF
jgi:hypothetical protein